MATLLAVDLGLKSGLALYEDNGRLRWYRSKNFGSAARLRQGVGGLLNEIPELEWLILEGSSHLANIWERAAERQALNVQLISAETWRSPLLYARHRRSGRQAKQYADQLARRVIDWSGAPQPTALRHDTAEAILIGLWGVLTIGWLEALPPTLK